MTNPPYISNLNKRHSDVISGTPLINILPDLLNALVFISLVFIFDQIKEKVIQKHDKEGSHEGSLYLVLRLFLCFAKDPCKAQRLESPSLSEFFLP